MHTLLDILPDGHQLPHVPTQLWLILSLEICVRDSFGTYLLLTYPSYGISTPPAEGHWSPPFFGYPVEVGFSAPETVGAVRRLFESAERSVDTETAVHQLAYLLGLSSVEVEHIDSFTELKSSPRTPDQNKCYRIMRFRLRSVSERSLRNLADPECRKGYVFLPLSAMEEDALRPGNRSPWERFYLGKPIMTNVCVALRDGDHRKSMAAAAIDLRTDLFFREQDGLLICADLAGYGRACQYATSQMHSFDQTGREIATRFRESVASLFYEFVCKVGIQQVHMAGDGFLAGLPLGNSCGDLTEVIPTILDSYSQLLRRIETLNGCIKEENIRVGSRLAMHYGHYRYGRMALARSFTADFDGASIVEVARLEQGLAAATKGQASVDDPRLKPLKGAKHTLAITSDLALRASEILSARHELSFLGEFLLGAKESSLEASVFRLEAVVAP
jgi:hypothetical protein